MNNTLKSMFCTLKKTSLIDSVKQKQQRNITFPAAFLFFIVSAIFCQCMDGKSELLQVLVCQPHTINMITPSCDALRPYSLNSIDLYPENLLKPVTPGVFMRLFNLIDQQDGYLLCAGHRGRTNLWQNKIVNE